MGRLAYEQNNLDTVTELDQVSSQDNLSSSRRRCLDGSNKFQSVW